MISTSSLSTKDVVKKLLLPDEEIKDITKIIVPHSVHRNRVNKLGIMVYYFISSYGRLFRTSRHIHHPIHLTRVEECNFRIREMKNPAKPTLFQIFPYNNHSSANIDVYYENGSTYTNIRKLVFETFVGTFDRRIAVLYNKDGNPLNNHVDNIDTVKIKEICLSGSKDIRPWLKNNENSLGKHNYYKISFKDGKAKPMFFKGVDEIAIYLSNFLLNLKVSTIRNYIHHHFDKYTKSYLDEFLEKENINIEKISVEEYLEGTK